MYFYYIDVIHSQVQQLLTRRASPKVQWPQKMGDLWENYHGNAILASILSSINDNISPRVNDRLLVNLSPIYDSWLFHATTGIKRTSIFVIR